LEKSTLLVKLKIHSTFNKFFTESEYSVDINRYIDMLFYLKSMHPKFMKYLDNQEVQGDFNEGYVLLDDKLHLLTNEELYLLKAKENSTIHLVPSIVGGGGKRGGLLAIFAIFALIAFTGGLGLAGAGAAAGGGAAGAVGASGAAIAPAGGGFFGSIFKAFNAMPSFLKNMVGNIGLRALSAIFMKQPKQSESEAIRENGMFNSLTNSTSSGTAIAIHYGMPRISGQFLSGYIDSVEHGKSDTIRVGDQF
jgi:predicted phage tail protein